MDSMANALANIGTKMIWRFVTEKFLSRMIVLALRQISKSTANTVDDEIVCNINEALGSPCKVD